jgi:hypothetical protein
MVFDLTETCGYAREWSLSGQVHGESKKDSYEEWSGTLIPLQFLQRIIQRKIQQEV